MKKGIRIVSVFALIVVFLVIALSVAGFFLEEKLVNYSISEINKHVKAKIEVKSADFSFFRDFPFATVNLNDVRINEGSLEIPAEFEPGLLSVNKLVLRFNIISIIKKNYIIDDLKLSNGWINLYFNNEGRGNYNIFSPSSSPSGNWLLDVNSFTLEEVNISYIDLRNGWIMKGIVKSGVLKGNFSAQNQNVSLSASTRVGELKQGSFVYISNRDVSLKTSLKFTKDEVLVEKSFISIDQNRLALTGYLGINKGNPIQISMNGSIADADFLFSFLSQYNYSLGPNTRTRGKISFTFNLNGYNKTGSPFLFNLNFGSDRFTIFKNDLPSITINNLLGSFTNGEKGSPEMSELTMSFDRIVFSESSVSGSLRVKNIFSPLFHLKLKGSFNISDLAYAVDSISIKSGYIQGSTEAIGRLQNIENISFSDFKNVRIYSDLSFSDISTEIMGNALHGIKGTLSASNQNIDVKSFSGFINNVPWNANLFIENFPATIFGSGKSKIKSNFSIDFVDSKWFSPSDAESSKTNESASFLKNILSFEGNARIGRLQSENLICNQVLFDYQYFDPVLVVSNIIGNSCGGKFAGRFYSNLSNPVDLNVVSDITLQDIDVSDLFLSFNNFGQSVVINDNISGKLSGTVSSKAMLINGSVFNKNLLATASLRIDNGRLKNVDQLKSLSSFISLDELNDIQFETLQNTISIENEMFNIPKMEIKSSALNLYVSGQHSFSNNYLYNVQLYLSDILFGKARDKNPQNGEYAEVDDNSGRVNLYLKIQGDSLDYKVSYDRLSSRRAFIQNVKEEGQTLREILKEEFSFLGKRSSQNDLPTDSVTFSQGDSIKTEAKKTKKHEKESKKFTIEWDDE